MRRPGWAALGLVRRLQTSYEQDFSPARRGQSPWCEPDRGPTVNGGGLDRQMEVITMAVVAILVAAGVIALVILGLFFVVGVGWFIMSSL